MVQYGWQVFNEEGECIASACVGADDAKDSWDDVGPRVRKYMRKYTEAEFKKSSFSQYKMVFQILEYVIGTHSAIRSLNPEDTSDA